MHLPITEHAFLSLLDVIEANATYKAAFKNALAEHMILSKFTAFRKTLDSQLKSNATRD